MRLILIFCLIILACTLKLGGSLAHEYWFNEYNPKVFGNPSRWYYCNYKCLYL
jgi:hypothetical protein